MIQAARCPRCDFYSEAVSASSARAAIEAHYASASRHRQPPETSTDDGVTRPRRTERFRPARPVVPDARLRDWSWRGAGDE